MKSTMTNDHVSYGRRANEDAIIQHAVIRPVNKDMIYRLMLEHYQQYQDQSYLTAMFKQWEQRRSQVYAQLKQVKR